MNHHYGRPPRSASKSTKNSSSPAPPLGLPQTRSHRSSASPSYDFQMMDVQIGIDIMEGLVMECIKNKGESPLGSTQINAIVSCNKNVSRSRQIATHVPSLPLTVPVASFGDKVHNFLVRWPADFDPHGDALSTFKLSRLLKRDAYYSDVPGINTGFVPDEIELSIGLMRGSEILTLGKTNLIITGNETDEMIIDLPISNEKEVVKNKQRDPSPLKRTSSKLFGKSPKSNVKSLKPLSFSADKVRKFHLTDNAMIRLRVQLFPRQESGSFDMPATASRTRPYIVQHGSPSHDYSSYSREDSTDSSSNDSYSGHIHHHEYIPSVPPHKYHPHIPMDELEQDFGHVLHVRNVNGGHSSSRPAPPTRSISKNSRQERSYVEDFSPDKYDMRLHERNSSSAYNYEAFGGHSSQRARTPGKSRMMYDRHQTHSNQYVLQNDRRYSRSRQSQMKTKPIQYLTNGGVSYEVSDEDTENINFHQSGRVETKVPLKHSSGKPRSSNHSERNESPMTWLYDKIIGGNPSSTTESLTTSRHSNHKKSPSYHRNNSTKRTMRV
jgi:hypothetical protein